MSDLVIKKQIFILWSSVLDFIKGGGRAADGPRSRPPPVPEPAKFRKYNLRILSWNIVGTQSKDRMRALAKVMRKYKPDVILLQEIHGISKAGIENLHSFLPNYNWILNWGPKQKRGVGVGVRNNMSTPFPLNEAYRDKEGNIIAVDFTLRGRDCRAISIYRPRKTPVEKLLEPHMKMMKTPRDLVVARDFNIDKEADAFQPFRESLEEKGLVRLDWDSPTHWQGGNIDHIFVSESIPEDTKAITAIPTLFKDHTILVGGVIGKNVNTSSHLKRLPKYATKDPEFQKEVMERAGGYKGDPMSCLQKVKSTAWEIWEEWKGKSEISQRYKRLWDLQVLRGSLAQKTSLPRPKEFSPLLEEITVATVNKYQIKKGHPWRRIILPRVITTCDEWIEYWEGQLDDFLTSSMPMNIPGIALPEYLFDDPLCTTYIRQLNGTALDMSGFPLFNASKGVLFPKNVCSDLFFKAF